MIARSWRDYLKRIRSATTRMNDLIQEIWAEGAVEQGATFYSMLSAIEAALVRERTERPPGEAKC
jgi:hypothetical protein